MRQRLERINEEHFTLTSFILRVRILMWYSDCLWTFASAASCVGRSLGTAVLTCLFSAMCSWWKKLLLLNSSQKAWADLDDAQKSFRFLLCPLLHCNH